jgi:DNA-binding transcriptional MerR regulator
MVQEWVSIIELAEKTGIAENTARRYVKRFKKFFPNKNFGQTTKYPPDVAKMLLKISSMYYRKLNTQEILEILNKEEIQTLERDYNETTSKFVLFQTPNIQVDLLEQKIAINELYKEQQEQKKTIIKLQMYINKKDLSKEKYRWWRL